ncbi:hypothetical protein IWQ61_001947 [Dispira simplex]|nr:hypothetical protein IWQ61_001947 [Dispira simplex]
MPLLLLSLSFATLHLIRLLLVLRAKTRHPVDVPFEQSFADQYIMLETPTKPNTSHRPTLRITQPAVSSSSHDDTIQGGLCTPIRPIRDPYVTPSQRTSPLATPLSVAHGSGQAPPPGTFSTPLATPFIRRLNGMELQWRLRDAYRMLREKEDNLVLAAEIGQNLLQANEQLKVAYEKVLVEQQELLEKFQASQRNDGNGASGLPPSSESEGQTHAESATDVASPKRASKERLALLNDLVGELEQANADLHIKLDETEHILKEKTRTYHREVTSLQQEIRGIHQVVEKLEKVNAQLEDDKQRVVRDKSELAKTLQQLSRRGAETEALQHRIDELERSLAIVSTGKAGAEKALLGAHQELHELQVRCLEYQDQLAQRDTEIIRLTEQSQLSDELQNSLQEAQETIQILNARLEELQSNGPGMESPSSTAPREVKTLLNEVEDRRQELQSQHELLRKRHKGLVKAHSMTVHQQERMRHHITRLTQMTNQPSQEDRLRRLEQILGQTQSENQRLQRRIDWLERMRSEQRLLDYYGDNDGDPFQEETLDDSPEGMDFSSTTGEPLRNGTLPAPGQDMISCLHVRLDQLLGENDQLREELRTSQMLKMSESEKLYQVETSLQEREQEIHALRARITRFRFEMDELENKLRTRQLTQGNDNETVTSPSKPCGATSAMAQLCKQLSQNTREPKPRPTSGTYPYSNTISPQDGHPALLTQGVSSTSPVSAGIQTTSDPHSLVRSNSPKHVILGTSIDKNSAVIQSGITPSASSAIVDMAPDDLFEITSPTTSQSDLQLPHLKLEQLTLLDQGLPLTSSPSPRSHASPVSSHHQFSTLPRAPKQTFVSKSAGNPNDCKQQ